MRKYTYENHVIKEPLLPFIFHPFYNVTGRINTPNWHTNIEFLYCIGGSGYVRCGMENTAFTPGDIFVVNADTPHSIGSDGSVQYRCLIIDNSFCEENDIYVSQLVFQSYVRDPELCRLFDAVVEAFSQRDSGHICAVADIRYAVLGLLRKVCREYAVPGRRDARSDEYVKKAISYIRQNLANEITLDDVAAFAGISKFHLSRQFKAYTDSTVIGTVNLIRCTEARRLIEGGMQVSEAAALCGYENLSYFTRAFKKHFKALPSSFLPKR